MFPVQSGVCYGCGDETGSDVKVTGVVEHIGQVDIAESWEQQRAWWARVASSWVPRPQGPCIGEGHFRTPGSAASMAACVSTSKTSNQQGSGIRNTWYRTSSGSLASSKGGRRSIGPSSSLGQVC